MSYITESQKSVKFKQRNIGNTFLLCERCFFHNYSLNVPQIWGKYNEIVFLISRKIIKSKKIFVHLTHNKRFHEFAFKKNKSFSKLTNTELFNINELYFFERILNMLSIP